MGKPTGFLEFERELPTDRGPLKRLAAWKEFHDHMPEATGNSGVELVVQTRWDQRVGPLYRALELKLEYPAMAAETTHEHEAVLRAILKRDAGAARAAMRRHMDLTKKRYSKDWKELNT